MNEMDELETLVDRIHDQTSLIVDGLRSLGIDGQGIRDVAIRAMRRVLLMKQDENMEESGAVEGPSPLDGPFSLADGRWVRSKQEADTSGLPAISVAGMYWIVLDNWGVKWHEETIKESIMVVVQRTLDKLLA